MPRVLDKEKNTLEAHGVDSTKGCIVLNLTAADVISFTGNTLSHTILQTKDIPVNIPDSKNGKGWLVPGKLVIFVNPIENIISEAGVFFVDHTIGYAATVTSGSLGPIASPLQSVALVLTIFHCRYSNQSCKYSTQLAYKDNKVVSKVLLQGMEIFN